MDLSGTGVSFSVDERGNISRIASENASVAVPLEHTHYEVDGAHARLRAEDVSGTGAEFAATDAATEAALPLRFEFAVAEELRIRPSPARSRAPEAHAPTATELPSSWSLTLALPLSAEFHLPEYSGIGRKLDASIPVADFYAARMTYNHLIVGCGGIWLRFLSEQRRTGRLGVHIERHDEMFLLTVAWHRGRDDAEGWDPHWASLEARIACFDSLDEAMRDYERYLTETVGVRERTWGNPYPAWVLEAPAFVPVDMIHCHGRIENDFAAIGRLADEMKEKGAPRDTIVHLIGYNGPFDSTYPTYRPAEALGGPEGLQAAADQLHRNGYRLSVHVNGNCIDPFHPDIDELLPMVLRDSEGRYVGYNTRVDTTPPSRAIRFHTEEIAFVSRGAIGGSIVSAQVHSPVLCEAMLTVGGISPSGGGADPEHDRIAITLNGRTHRPPTDANLSSYQIPFPMRLDQGRNAVTIAADGDSGPRLEGAWVRVDSCYVPDSVHAIATTPLLIADTRNEKWIKLFCDEIEELLNQVPLDLLYIDYTTFYHPIGSRRLFAALAERLPDLPIHVEWLDSIEALGSFAFCGGGKMHLVKGSPKLAEVAGRKLMPVTHGIEKRYSWMDQTSPVCDFTRRYGRFKAGSNFAPLNWVASIYPHHQTYADPAELRAILDQHARLNFVPILRINYREYGLDDATAAFLRSMNRSD